MYQFVKNNFPKRKTFMLKYALTGFALLMGLGLAAQNTETAALQDSFSIFSNTLFNTLLAVIILLLIIIAVLASVLKNVAEATKEKYMKNKNLPIIATIVLLSSAKSTFAQQAASNPVYMGLNPGTFYLLISIIVFELIFIAVLVNSIQLFIRKENIKISKSLKTKEEPSILEKLNASVAVEEEASILMDHDYDGIKELDNNLPPWWKYGFYATIVWGLIYLIHFHVTSTGDLQAAEYKKSMEAAHEAKEAYQKMSANNVSESNVKMITDKHELAEAAITFKELCSACHGNLGEGGIGPNLTDNYWLHGGSLKDIFISIKYGWPEKGMKSWQAELSPSKISEITSYIMTIAGSNPPNAKEKQGELYVEQNTAPIANDSTAITDSTAVLVPKTDSAATMTK